VRAAVQYLRGENRHQDDERHTHEADHGKEQQDGAHRRESRYIRPPFLQLHHHGSDRARSRQRLDPHQGQRSNHGKVAQAIDEKAVAFTEGGNNHTCQRGPHQPRHIHHGRVEGDGIAQILPVLHHLNQEGLPPGHIKGIDQPLKTAQDQNVRDRHPAGERQRSQQ
jgi:hypothetical protein